MSTIKVEVQLSLEQLLKAVEQLSQQDLDYFVSQVIALQAQRQAKNHLEAEAELSININQGIPLDIKKYYNELVAKAEFATVPSYKYGELLGLTEQIEQLQAQYFQDLAELATLRQFSLKELIEILNLQTQIYV